MKLQNRTRRNSCLLVLAAFIWGTSFVAQAIGGGVVGPYTFNCIRSIIGGIVLLPVIALSNCLLGRGAQDADNADSQSMPSEQPVEYGHAAKRAQRRKLLIGGISCGTAMAVATNLQQMGMFLGSGAGKAGFLTACYILLVPVLGLFLHKKCGWNVWIGIAIAVAGLYLLCIHGDFSIQFSDFLVLLCALVFAVHILVIDHFTVLVDGVRLSCAQFFVCGILSAVPMFFVDMGHSAAGIRAWLPALADFSAWLPILYVGVLSCGVAYTLQIIGQRDVNPATASLLMSLESVFSVLAGWVVLGEVLRMREILGCVLILGAVVLAQLPLELQKY